MKDQIFKSNGFWWQIQTGFEQITSDNIYGPFCIDCYAEMEFPSDAIKDADFSTGQEVYDNTWTGFLTCPACNRKIKLTTGIYKLKYIVAQKYMSKRRSFYDKYSLDEPIKKIQARAEDDKYFVSAAIAEKDGKSVGVVYFGEKKKDQDKSDYSQSFVDLDEELVRFDKSNKNPKEILSKYTVEFKGSVNKIEFKEKKKS